MIVHDGKVNTTRTQTHRKLTKKTITLFYYIISNQSFNCSLKCYNMTQFLQGISNILNYLLTTYNSFNIHDKQNDCT